MFQDDLLIRSPSGYEPTPEEKRLLQTCRRCCRVSAACIYLPSAVVRGIVGDARERGLDHEPVPTIYYCRLIMQPGLYFLARTYGNPMSLGQIIRRELHQIDSARSVYEISTLTAHLSDVRGEFERSCQDFARSATHLVEARIAGERSRMAQGHGADGPRRVDFDARLSEQSGAVTSFVLYARSTCGAVQNILSLLF